MKTLQERIDSLKYRKDVILYTVTTCGSLEGVQRRLRQDLDEAVEIIDELLTQQEAIAQIVNEKYKNSFAGAVGDIRELIKN